MNVKAMQYGYEMYKCVKNICIAYYDPSHGISLQESLGYRNKFEPKPRIRQRCS